jgi:hypothetical protein
MIKPEVIKEGYVVSIGLTPGKAPCDCYIGLVKGSSRQGIKINPVKWDSRTDCMRLSREEFYIPWTNIDSMLVCTN